MLNCLKKRCEAFGVSYSWGIERRLTYLEETQRMIGDEISRLTKIRNSGGEAGNILLGGIIEDWLKWYRRFGAMIQEIKYPMREKTDRITDEMIERAKRYPISELLGTERKSLKCPFHEDRHPSASQKNNKLHCFVCYKTWGTIDFVMEREGLGFKDAVKRLQ